MGKRRKHSRVWFVTLSGLLLAALSILFTYLGRKAGLDPEVWGPHLYQPPILLSLLLGLLIVLKGPDNLYGWTWIGLGFFLGALLPFGQNYATLASLASPELPLERPAAMLGNYAWFLGLAMFPLTMLYFPTGKPPTPPWRYLGWAIAASVVPVLALGWMIGPESTVPVENSSLVGEGIRRTLELVLILPVVFIFLSIPLSAVSLIHRYLLADFIVRQQLKWFAYGAVLNTFGIASDFVYTAPGYWEPLKEGLMIGLMPITVGIAIFRYQLWDINVVIRKTLIYSVVTSHSCRLLFWQCAPGAERARLMTDEQGPIAVVLSTLLTAALFLRCAGVQNGIDRRFYRRKYDARQMIAQFAQSARNQVELEALQAELLRVVQDTVQPAQATLWLRRSDE